VYAGYRSAAQECRATLSSASRRPTIREQVAELPFIRRRYGEESRTVAKISLRFYQPHYRYSECYCLPLLLEEKEVLEALTPHSCELVVYGDVGSVVHVSIERA
jgi:hypothetical protein